MSVMTNQLKKGARVKLDNGWEAVLEDNQCKRNTRLATEYGISTDKGSIYVHDIVEAYIDGKWVPVLLNDKQKASKDFVTKVWNDFKSKK